MLHIVVTLVVIGMTWLRQPKLGCRATIYYKNNKVILSMKQQPHWGKVLCKAAGTLEAFRGALCWHLDSPMLRERRAVHFSSMPIISILSFPVISQTVVLPTSRFLPLWWQEVHAINYLCSAGKKRNWGNCADCFWCRAWHSKCSFRPACYDS